MIYRFILILALLIGSVQLTKGAEKPNELITVAPSKLEITADPGETIDREFTIANYSDQSLNLTLQFENFSDILAEDLPPIFSLGPYLSAPKRDFTLDLHDQIIVPIKITLPADISPGGFYGTPVFSITSATGATTSTRVVTRLAPLIFLRVKGEMVEAGSLLDFNLLGRRWRFSSTPPTFYLTYQNTGNIYLNPYGAIELKNKISGIKTNISIDPWFVLPGATRIREISAPNSPAGGLLTGWYQARLALNRGFGDQVDTRIINFVVVSPLVFGVIIFILTILLIVVIKYFRKFVFAGLIIFTFANLTFAQVASSPNYRLQSDSLNFSGGLSSSLNYGLESTLGETATGGSTSTNYGLLVGYQQMLVSTLSITAPSDASLSAITAAGVSTGSVAWTVITDNPAGYTLSIKAGSSPALTAGSESVSDYSPGGAVPDYSWSVGAAASAFGFSPEGADTASRYLDNGSSCGIGASNASDQCWDGFSTANRTIAQSSTSNTPSGVATTVKLKVEVGADKTQTTGSYTATLTVTATAR
ncbi:MAG: hypothetical protein V1704_04665 [Candidatus Vogelbacteria bacterium]